jgi:hypothetical protein
LVEFISETVRQRKSVELLPKAESDTKKHFMCTDLLTHQAEKKPFYSDKVG